MGLAWKSFGLSILASTGVSAIVCIGVFFLVRFLSSLSLKYSAPLSFLLRLPEILIVTIIHFLLAYSIVFNMAVPVEARVRMYKSVKESAADGGSGIILFFKQLGNSFFAWTSELTGPQATRVGLGVGAAVVVGVVWAYIMWIIYSRRRKPRV